MSEPFQFTSGPRSARIMLCGEAWGESEALAGAPFMGASGIELFRMLGEAWGVNHQDVIQALYSWRDGKLTLASALSIRELWLERAGALLTNVFTLRPPNNNLDALCGNKAAVGPAYALPHVRQGKYILPEYLPHVERLRQEILASRPAVIVAFGNTATWALLQATNIGSIRGAVAESLLVNNYKVLPTYHPAAVLRNWSWRVIVIADLIKALRESAFTEIRRPERKVLVNPTLDEALAWADEALTRASRLSVDIETGQRQIKCIGFARSRANALVIPFVDLTKPGGCYWPDPASELIAWAIVRRLLESPIPKLFQNGVYDLQYILRMGIRPENCLHDTMLLHHALFPELQKGLGFLGSIYTNEASWKLMRKEAPDSEKRDE